MPDELPRPAIGTLRQLLEQELITFQKLCEHAHLRRDHVLGARYCLCTALDEAATQTKWGGGADAGVEWITNGLAARFHEDRQGGDKIYLLIGRLLADTREHLDLVELIYRILSLGFEGRYRYEVNGQRKHESIRQRLYEEIAAQRSMPATLLLSDIPSVSTKPSERSRLRLMVLCGMLALLTVGTCFTIYRSILDSRAEQLQSRIAALGTMAPVVVPPPSAPSPLHLRLLLAREIAAGLLEVNEDDRHSTVVFRGDAMFASGTDEVNSRLHSVIVRVGEEVTKVPGQITITGFTDSLPIHTRRFSSNEALSLARATQVAQVLQSAGVPAARIQTIGRGAVEPLSDNTTPQGRAQNRRVVATVSW